MLLKEATYLFFSSEPLKYFGLQWNVEFSRRLVSSQAAFAQQGAFSSIVILSYPCFCAVRSVLTGGYEQIWRAGFRPFGFLGLLLEGIYPGAFFRLLVSVRGSGAFSDAL